MGTVSLKDGTFGQNELNPADTADNDSVDVTNAKVTVRYTPGGGNDIYSLTGSSVGITNNFAFWAALETTR